MLIELFIIAETQTPVRWWVDKDNIMYAQEHTEHSYKHTEQTITQNFILKMKKILHLAMTDEPWGHYAKLNETLPKRHHVTLLFLK